MPVIGQDQDMMEEFHGTGATNFSFSATRLEKLGATEYTLVTIAADVSSSVDSYASEIEKALKEVIKSCRHSPRADNLMIRIILFANKVVELHGYKLLSECAEDDYIGCIKPYGMTALCDAGYNGVESMAKYGRTLIDQDFEVNGALYVITDGMDNHSTATETMLKESIQNVAKHETLESLMSVLIGVGTEADTLDGYLKGFKEDAGFAQYVSVGDASAKNLAKVADFVSRSISSQSQALGTGGPSQSLSF